MHDDDLTPAEREALRALPRERPPSDLLEERVVRALKARGIIRPSASPRLVPSRPWIGAAAAAIVAIFACGFALGQWLEARHGTRALLPMHQEDAPQAAAMVQQAGSAYIAALTRLADLSDSSSTREVLQGREVAMNILHAAASQMVRIAPEEPVASRILQGLDRSRSPDSSQVAAMESHQVIWF